jgi:hypothetical protein
VKAVVVYESLYGNTHRIAEAVAEGLRSSATVDVLTVADAEQDAVEGADLVVVGGPTHIHGMVSHTSLRGAVEGAAKKGQTPPEVDAESPVLRDWFDGLASAQHTPAAAFDTRLDKPKLLTGSAAKAIGRRLRRHGFDLVVEPESFVLEDPDAPVGDAELERARDWGKSLGLAATTSR